MKTVTIVGVGALGSHLVPLVRNLEAQIQVIDFDRVEQKNTQSQFHGKAAVGKNKALALQQTMQFLWGLKVGTIPHKLTSDNDDQLLSKSSLIIDCLDNGVARRLVQGFARRTHTPCLHGALAADGSFGRVIWDEQFKIDDESAGGQATCEDGRHLAFISIVSSYLAYATQHFLTTGKKQGFQISPARAFSI
jgi:molybdopterin/thiamine biosynthesis adenylyltransferase